jgi:hypothetical protein
MITNEQCQLEILQREIERQRGREEERQRGRETERKRGSGESQ